MRGRLSVLIGLVLVLGLYIGTRPGAQDPTEALARHRNLGKAFYENPTTQLMAVEEFKQALDLVPDSTRERVNYGLALLRAGEVDEGVAQLQQAQRIDPTIPHTWFNLGITFKKNSEFEPAIEQFEEMVRLVPDEPISHYNLGYLYKLTDRPDEALRQFERAAALDPNLAGPHFQLFNMYREAGRTDEAVREQNVFQQIKRRQAGAAIPEDLDWSAYAEIYDPVDPAMARDDSPPAPLQFGDRLVADAPVRGEAGLVPADLDADGRPDLIAWSAAGVHLYRNGTTRMAGGAIDPLTGVEGVVPGDYDNDGLPDLLILSGAGAAVYRNAGNGFEPAALGVPSRPFTAGVWLDYDHDYDLDLLLFGSPPALLRNNGDAGFSDRTTDFPFVHATALSARVFDLAPDTMGRDVFVTYADRPAALYRDRLAGTFEAIDVEEAPAGSRVLGVGDADHSGTTDVLIGRPSGPVVVLRNHVSGFEAVPLEGSGSGVALLADFENRAVADLVTGARLFRNEGAGTFRALGGAPIGPARAAVAADFDLDGRVDLALVRPDGTLHLLANATETGHAWVGVRLTGVKNLRIAPRAIVEVKAGAEYQKKLYEGVPLHFGLRNAQTVDTVRITWPNGLVQNEIQTTASQELDYREAQRLSGSCPMIFTWNGREFQFITDVLGVAPLGASSGDGSYFPTDHDEYVQIPGDALALRNGAYEIRITEELHEVAYLDQVRLIAVDHPAAIDIVTNDKFKAPPYPEFRLFGVGERVHPVRARDADGRDVAAALAARDRTYAEGFDRERSGVAAWHALELDFGAVTPDNRAVLVLNGWVDWADGSTFLAAAQEDAAGLVFPSLQVKDESGRWVTVVEDMGMPAGKPKTMAVDLTGRFLSASREVRILTNLSVYWDEIFLSEHPEAPEARLTPLDAAAAELRFRGFSTPEIDPARRQPEAFDYDRPLPLDRATWNPTPGLYTRFGDVRPLVPAVDDRFVIMGSGDELVLRYAAETLPALPDGWTRDFLLLVDGWAKDGDPNTAFSQNVEPLPFHAMSVYPYAEPERFPDGAAHRAYQQQYNTRPALRLLRPLSSSSTTSRLRGNY